jgi:hypothetical protein
VALAAATTGLCGISNYGADYLQQSSGNGPKEFPIPAVCDRPQGVYSVEKLISCAPTISSVNQLVAEIRHKYAVWRFEID